MAVDLAPTILFSSMLGITGFGIVESLCGAKQKRTPTQKYFLTALLVLLFINALGELFIASGAYRFAPGLAGAQLPLRMLLGPALYFYARAMMSGTIPDRTAGSYGVALSGPLMIILTMLPFLGLSASEKLSLADPSTRDPALFQLALLTCLASTLIFIVFTAVYLAMTFRLQTRHRAQLMDRYSDIHKQSMDWLRTVMLLWGAAWLLYAINSALQFMGWGSAEIGTFLSVFETVILLGFVHFALRQPMLEEAHKTVEAPQAQRLASLDTDRMVRIAAKLEHVMLNDKLYTENELSLRRLSDAINISENHISETLSQHMNTSFFHFVNDYRIEEAKIRLASTNCSIVTTAFDVGFSSRSTFNTAFKKRVGMTPSEYKNQAKSTG